MGPPQNFPRQVFITSIQNVNMHDVSYYSLKTGLRFMMLYVNLIVLVQSENNIVFYFTILSLALMGLRALIERSGTGGTCSVYEYEFSFTTVNQNMYRHSTPSSVDPGIVIIKRSLAVKLTSLRVNQNRQVFPIDFELHLYPRSDHQAFP
jgi:hypothetical protein